MDVQGHAKVQNARKGGANAPGRSRDDPPTLVAPHVAILAELAPRYDVLAASVISSTQIRKRVTFVTSHLLQTSNQPRVALLYSRVVDVPKLVTVVEQSKRVLVDEGRPWYQYNQLCDPPPDPRNRGDVVEETVLDPNVDDLSDDDESDSDGEDDEFEVMGQRFDKAVARPPPTRVRKSMRMFLSTSPVEHLESKPDVTRQSSEG
ncbi:hypothetical protein S7711_07370 [Stachybotrys chartarum IBT 7711]|uniref:DNA/RNA-binding protein Alba-like domain-containing protein n=1 Tax=Stachybotrys chartarum (strain CBS 109288 / IBT 7711) TaxID=1280523 RepID=A0A084AIA6_STACB|nr:hypothetical protein S7711_07370 [Stachybotrys chartarum IBT 7711]KFA52020.1 hypothetical protein S40293_02952 [Stachybotrys chartarum IBT 40293]KFA74166.1 hypothetical protein S40288_06524 [Stachybotrys chartarum IBT 40288]